jgi:hypothetical protein
MRRQDLEHIIRAAGAIADEQELVIIGSQALLGTYPSAPDELLVSMEADIYPLNAPEKSDLIDGSIGELSPFHEEFGYFAHGIGPETAVLARGWKKRLIPVSNENTGGITGLCLHPVDIAASKLMAGREMDYSFVRGLLEHALVSAQEIRAILDEYPPEQASTVEARLVRCLADAGETA